MRREMKVVRPASVLLILALTFTLTASAVSGASPQEDRKSFVTVERNRLSLAQQPWFPLGILVTPITRERRLELAQAGFDLVHLGELPPDRMREALDSLQSSGLRAAVNVGPAIESAGGGAMSGRKKLQDLISAVGNHPALALWESVDEPAWTKHSFEPLRQGCEFLHQIDPRRPIWTNQAPRGPVSRLEQFNQATDVAGCDIYPVGASGQSDLPNTSLSLVGDETIRSIASVGGKKPVLVILQGFAWSMLGDSRREATKFPTLDESRFMAYDAIVAGAAGLVWWSPDETWPRGAFWDDLKRLTSELRAIMPILEAPSAGPARVHFVGKPGSIAMSERQVGTYDALIVVNRSAKPSRVELRTDRASSWRTLFDDSPMTEKSETLVIDLAAWGVRVLTNDPAMRPARRNFRSPSVASAPESNPPLARGSHESIPNGSFELEDTAGMPSGWTVRDPTCILVDSQNPHGGQKSLRVTAESAALRPLVILRGIPVHEGRKYRLSAWMRSDTPGASGSFYAEAGRDGQFHTYMLPWTKPGTSWARYPLDLVPVPDDKGNVYVVLQVEGPGRVWFDDLELTEAR